MNTRITEMLGIEYPIIQGGMAWVAEHNLAAVTSFLYASYIFVRSFVHRIQQSMLLN